MNEVAIEFDEIRSREVNLMFHFYGNPGMYTLCTLNKYESVFDVNGRIVRLFDAMSLV